MFPTGLSLVAALCLVGSPSCRPRVKKRAPPPAVTDAIAAAPTPQARRSIVGAYINDIQALDFKANNYVVDFYVWFRWRAPDLHPSKTLELMNRYASGDNIREELYDKPQHMPDGSLYSIIRYQGRFATKFSLEKYPFDSQVLIVLMEECSPHPAAGVCSGQRTSGDARSVHHFAGLHHRRAQHEHRRQHLSDHFGRPVGPRGETYSRIVVTVPVTRPILAMSLKTFMPIALIVVCAALVFFVRPRYIEGRIGLGITALLTWSRSS